MHTAQRRDAGKKGHQILKEYVKKHQNMALTTSKHCDCGKLLLKISGNLPLN